MPESLSCLAAMSEDMATIGAWRTRRKAAEDIMFSDSSFVLSGTVYLAGKCANPSRVRNILAPKAGTPVCRRDSYSSLRRTVGTVIVK